jgi:hypothetical protein
MAEPLTAQAIRCTFCGLEGQLASATPGQAGLLSPGFHHEQNRIPGRTQVIVCDACDEILID